MRILLIEDEAAIADFVQRGLQAEGYAVSLASDGVEGERAALGDDVDLVVLDVMLPGRDGLEVLRGIRAAKPALPVVMLSARAEVEDRVAGLDGGATDYVTKPFSFDGTGSRPTTRALPLHVSMAWMASVSPPALGSPPKTKIVCPTAATAP